MTPETRVAVIGAGAVGCYFGGMLARAGVPVTLVGRPTHVDAIRRDGLLMDTLTFSERVHVAASTDVGAAAGAGVVLLSVKTGDTAASSEALAPHLAPGAVVVSMQNGVGNAPVIRRFVPGVVIPAAVYVSAEMSGPGHLRHNGRGDLVIGRDRQAPGDAAPFLAGLEMVERLFTDAGVPCRRSAAIDVDLWSKLAMNCAYNAISALGRSRYGRLAAEPATRAVLELAVHELEAVAAAEGVDLSGANLVEAAHRLSAGFPEALSSTAQDIALGRRTEIDDLNGYVVRRGAAHGIATPVNQTLHALVKLLEGAPAGTA